MATRAAINRRLEQLARRKRRCVTHGVKLWCLHELQWVGTIAEIEEASDLYGRLHPYLPKVYPSDQPCPACREPLWCEACLEAQSSRSPSIWIPDDLLTPEEWDRWRELPKLYVRRPGQHHEFPRIPEPAPPWMSKPIVTPEPTPPPIPKPQVSEPVVVPVAEIQGAIVTLNLPEVSDDADAALDTELAALVEQIKQRLTP